MGKKMTQKKEEKILYGAIQEFSQKGYDGTSMNDICQRSSVSKGLLYHYYENKKDLYLQCIRKIIQDYMRSFRTEEITSMNLMETFHFVEKLKLEYFQGHKAEIRLMLNGFYRTPQDVQQEIQKEFESTVAFSTQLILQLLEKEDRRKGVSLDMAAQVLLEASAIFMKQYVEKNLQEDEEIDFQGMSKSYYEFLDMLLYGILEKKNDVKEEALVE